MTLIERWKNMSDADIKREQLKKIRFRIEILLEPGVLFYSGLEGRATQNSDANQVVSP